MHDQQEIEQLASLLESSDDTRISEIVALIDRLADRGAIDTVLDRHRWRLASIRPPRPMTATRLLALPFEELLVPTDAWSPGMPRIPRHHLRGLIGTAMPVQDEAIANLAASLPGTHTMDDSVHLLEVGKVLWPAAAGHLFDRARASVANASKEDRELRLSCRLAARTLEIGEIVVRSMWRLPPRPMINLNDESGEAIAAVLGAAAANGRESFMLAIEILRCRSDSPALLVPCIAAGEYGLDRRELATCLSVVGESCLEAVRRNIDLVQSGSGIDVEIFATIFQSIAANLQSLGAVVGDLHLEPRQLRLLREQAATILLGHVKNAVTAEIPSMLDETGSSECGKLEKDTRAIANLVQIGEHLGIGQNIQSLLQVCSKDYIERAAAVAGDAGRFVMHVRIIEILFGSSTAIRLMARKAV